MGGLCPKYFVRQSGFCGFIHCEEHLRSARLPRGDLVPFGSNAIQVKDLIVSFERLRLFIVLSPAHA